MTAASATTEKEWSRSKAPHVNLFDMPELMPGAQPSASATQREQFEQRCRKLYNQEVAEEQQEREAHEAVRLAEANSAKSSDLEVMFPSLDPALVRTLYAEATSPEHAIETLLALSASIPDPVSSTVAGAEAGPQLPPWQLSVEDPMKFPSLDQVGLRGLNGNSLELDPDEDLGSAWRDRAKSAVDIPAPRPALRPSLVTDSQARRHRNRQKDNETEPTQPMTDYELRHRAGQLRAKQRKQYGRRNRAGGVGAKAAAGRQHAGGSRMGDGAESDKSEASEEDAAGGGGIYTENAEDIRDDMLCRGYGRRY